MHRASVFVSLSHFEGNPNTVLEAMASGCPLVVSNISQHREILDEGTALFCESYSSDGAATAIGAVFDDPVAAMTRAEAARLRATAWSIEHTASQYVRLYNSLALRDQVAT